MFFQILSTILRSGNHHILETKLNQKCKKTEVTNRLTSVSLNIMFCEIICCNLQAEQTY